MTCLGLPDHIEKLSMANVEACSSTEMESCNADQLQSFLDFEKELKSMYGNWSSKLDTNLIGLLQTSFTTWLARIQSKQKWDRVYQIWLERYKKYSEEAGLVMYVGFGLVVFVLLGQVYNWVKLKRLMSDYEESKYNYSDLETESETD